MEPLEDRIASLARAVHELVGIVARLNVETYAEARTEFPRRPEKPRVDGYPEVQDDLERLRNTLETWAKEWQADSNSQPHKPPPQ